MCSGKFQVRRRGLREHSRRPLSLTWSFPEHTRTFDAYEELKYVVKLTQEQVAKAAAAKTPEEVLALAREEGVTLTDEQLEEFSGGTSWGDVEGAGSLCPYCKHWGLNYKGEFDGKSEYECPSYGQWCREKSSPRRAVRRLRAFGHSTEPLRGA